MKKCVHVTHNGKVILKGKKDTTVGSWLAKIVKVENLGNQNQIIQNNYNQIILAAEIEATCTQKELVRLLNDTYKNHLMSGLSGAGPSFLMTLWDMLIPQAKSTINMLRNSRMNPLF